jgi:FkbM family methyltransferase
MYTISLGGMNYTNYDFDSDGELWLMQYVKQKLKNKKETLIFDVGAHKGAYLISLDSIFDATASVHSFEPSNAAFEKLKLFKCKNITAKLNNIGLSNSVGTHTLFCHTIGGTGSSIHNFDHKDAMHRKQHEETIQLNTLDAYCAENSISKIDFLKIDTEGNDYFVLLGAEKMLSEKKIECIQFEFSDKMIYSKTSFFDFYTLLSNHNYKLYRMLADGIQKIDAYSTLYEIYAGTNFYAEAK